MLSESTLQCVKKYLMEVHKNEINNNTVEHNKEIQMQQ